MASLYRAPDTELPSGIAAVIVASSEVLSPMRRDNVTLFGLLRRWWPDASQAQVLWLVLAGVVALLALYRARNHVQRGELAQAALVGGSRLHGSRADQLAALPGLDRAGRTWMVSSGGRSALPKGAADFLVFAQPLPMIASVLYESSVFWRMTWELLVVVPALICVLGLPR